jgi:hypothetical protein
MRLTWKDGLATLATGAAVALYLLWTNGSAAQGLSVRGIASLTLALGFVACASVGSNMSSVYVPGEEATTSRVYSVVMTIVGVVTLVAGIIAIVGANEAALGTMVVAMIVLWLVASLRHAFGGWFARAATQHG